MKLVVPQRLRVKLAEDKQQPGGATDERLSERLKSMYQDIMQLTRRLSESL